MSTGGEGRHPRDRGRPEAGQGSQGWCDRESRDADSYRTVEVTFRGLRPLAFWVDNHPSRGTGQVPIPRSLIHAADDTKLDALFDGDKVTIRVRAWKAEALGFA